MAQTDNQSASPFFGTAQSDPEQASPMREPQPAEIFAQRAAEPDEEEPAGGEIAVDVHETDDAIVIVSPIAGVDPEDVEIAVDDDSVTVSGERRDEHQARSKNAVVQEIYWGKFSRTIELPAGADVEKAKAAFKHGVLTVTVPKSAKAKKRTIKVKTVD